MVQLWALAKLEYFDHVNLKIKLEVDYPLTDIKDRFIQNPLHSTPLLLLGLE